MIDDNNTQPNNNRDKMIEQVNVKEERRLRAERQKQRSLWFGLGALGMVGWQIIVPTLLGLFIGTWIDSKWPGTIPWTLALLLFGLIVGCINAWRWIMSEQHEIERNQE